MKNASRSRLMALGILAVLSLCYRVVWAQKPSSPPVKPAAPSRAGAAKTSPATPGTTSNSAPSGPVPVALTVEALDREGDLALRAGKWDAAIASFRQSVARSPKDIRAWAGLGGAYGSSKRYAEAADAYQQAAALNPTSFEFQYFLAGSLTELDRFDPARTAYERAIELNPDSLEARLRLGFLYERRKDWRGARAAMLDALGYAPDNPLVHDALGDVNEQDGRHEDALLEYEASLRADPTDFGAKAGRGTALSSLKRYDEAEKQMRDLVATASKEQAAQAHGSLAQVLDAEKKYDEAISEYRIALGLQNDDPTLWGNLGWTQYNAGKYDDAIVSSRKALTLDGKQTYVRFNLGLIYAVQNRWPDAQKEYRLAVSDAYTPDIRAGLNDVRDALLKTPDAPALRQALSFLSGRTGK